MRLLSIALVLSLTLAAAAPATAEPAGMVRLPSAHSYAKLVARLDAAVKSNKMAVVTRASATVGAKRLGRTIPGNMVVGVFHPRFAVRMLAASVAAGYEAPIRFYITEGADGRATLSYRLPSAIFADYPEGGPALRQMATELDAIFAAIAAEAAK